MKFLTSVKKRRAYFPNVFKVPLLNGTSIFHSQEKNLGTLQTQLFHSEVAIFRQLEPQILISINPSLLTIHNRKSPASISCRNWILTQRHDQ